jgi:phasin family protein
VNAKKQLEGLGEGGMEAAMGLANIYMESAEQLLKLQLDAAKAALEENARNAKALLEVNDVQKLMALRSSLAESSLERAMGFSRDVYDVASRTQQEITQLMEQRVAEFSKNLAGTVDKAAKGAPAGADVAMAALKSSLSAGSAAMENLTKAARQMAELSQTNLRAASGIGARALKGAGKPGKK